MLYAVQFGILSKRKRKFKIRIPDVLGCKVLIHYIILTAKITILWSGLNLDRGHCFAVTKYDGGGLLRSRECQQTQDVT